MKILHRYILSLMLRNLLLSLLVLVLVFSVFDFLDRIDNVLGEDPSFWTTAQYFAYKLPLTISLMLPASMIVATLFTVGVLSKNSEFTAMRAAGLRIFWLVKPILLFSLALSLLAIAFNETVVPHSQRRVRELYNIDIRKKVERGIYSQTDFWWRTEDAFYAASLFDSRSNTLHGLSILEEDGAGNIVKRTLAQQAKWLGPALGWSMKGVREYTFEEDGTQHIREFASLPLPIQDTPEDFYDAETDPNTMSYQQLKRFTNKQAAYGISIQSYLADLHSKFSFHFVIFIVTLVVIPFALLPARTGSMAKSFMAALLIGFSYYAVHSLSVAMGRAEFWPPLLAAWMANIVLGLIGLVLNSGAESPA